MATNLKRGENAFIDKEKVKGNPLTIGFQFDFECDTPHDIDASAFLLGADGRIQSDADFIFYNQRNDKSGGFIELLDSDDIAMSKDRHQFTIDLTRVPSSVHRIVFCLTLHEAELRNQNFGMAKRVCIRILNGTTDDELLTFESADELTTETALHLGELYRKDHDWKFRGVGQGYAGGLDAMARGFGVNIQPPRVDEFRESEFPLESQVPRTIADLETDKEPEPELNFEEQRPTLSRRKRRTSTDILAAQAAEIRGLMKPILVQINTAIQNSANESGSRLLLDKILQEVLGYSFSEIKPEQKIQGRSADYVISPAGLDTIVIEAKRVGLALREKQLYQATGYAAHSGISWVILTNLAVWELYKVTNTAKIVATLVFTIDLRKGLTDDAAYYFALISRKGITRKGHLERLWQTRKALSTESLARAILNDEVLIRIRNVISRENGIHLDISDVRAAVEQDILKLEN